MLSLLPTTGGESGLGLVSWKEDMQVQYIRSRSPGEMMTRGVQAANRALLWTLQDFTCMGTRCQVRHMCFYS